MLYLVPFLFLFLFRNIDSIGEIKTKLIYLILPLLIATQSVFYTGLLAPKNFGVFREIGLKINNLENKNDLKKCEIASNYNNIGYLNYYLKKPLTESITDWSNADVVYQLAERAKKSNKKQFLYTWSNSFHIPMYYEVIQKHYPSIIDTETYFGSSFHLFSKNKRNVLTPERNILQVTKPLMTSDEFFGELKVPVENVYRKIKDNQYILLKTKGKLHSNSPLYFVVTLERNGEMVKNGESPLFYTAFDQAKLNPIKRSTEFFTAFDIPKEALPTDIIKIYFWNPKKYKVEIDGVKLYFQKD